MCCSFVLAITLWYLLLAETLNFDKVIRRLDFPRMLWISWRADVLIFISFCLFIACFCMGSQSNIYLTVILFLSFWLCFLGPLYKSSSVFWIDCLFLASQPPVVKTEMVTISDATQRTEISTKEIPIVQTETKTITYESSQVWWWVRLQSSFYYSYVDQHR